MVYALVFVVFIGALGVGDWLAQFHLITRYRVWRAWKIDQFWQGPSERGWH